MLAVAMKFTNICHFEEYRSGDEAACSTMGTFAHIIPMSFGRVTYAK